ncbi:hypothetical protein BDR07DRAFT_1378973 [Suillus spraguei]|nr:hypothetical protein BDR07DRAFT_1378973 [Suillus spraguei]
MIAGAAPANFSLDTLLKPCISLTTFHWLKHAIVDAGACRGKRGEDKPWAIPKLELLQGVIPSIYSHGAIVQWSADPTEHAHIKVVKESSGQGTITTTMHKVERFDLTLQMRAQEDCEGHESNEDNESGLAVPTSLALGRRRYSLALLGYLTQFLVLVMQFEVQPALCHHMV